MYSIKKKDEKKWVFMVICDNLGNRIVKVGF